MLLPSGAFPASRAGAEASDRWRLETKPGDAARIVRAKADRALASTVLQLIDPIKLRAHIFSDTLVEVASSSDDRS